ncbi:Uncharacterized conserved protein YgiB, involved in bioifilm formation, UPF0441/DUF1190 family [Pseudomonas sp. NFACC23-1]|uniref:DUF1190 domain-containing protein n=1 Tax=unclassified Pseudomonas TaxID=196821 RepID=UPI00088A5E68|nr:MULTISPECIES: DUF1190 domain-containing protein [unclassified Pseudomonas]SDB45822.1 Uncharacterized conserved protein YgiB, involved in bioifilm formation, UPF0441/DUF1190 family [Pseudomonas sp. NFACC17-2]SEJ63993.1 Uncharacterized conserved protein YgiB, involved in bioifilm formation, UPF0441/DUF1190 family [Pseudomonas sp. NFACC23-1]SFW80742.1 Uncharacterized conserved protein YgiB, involved in bioifilm formation, UPF0441/DUF1190 family [Pseudomonas sp. NFACC16-2]
MKRSKYVQLSLAASVALAISGCGPAEKTYKLQKKYNFQSVQQCVDEKLPVDICADAYMSAMAEHRRIAPVYDSQADCDADFVPDWCQQDSAGKFIPKLGGFELSADGEVTQSQVDAARAQLPASEANVGGSGFGNLLTGMLIGNMLSGNRNSYYAEPVYRYRDDRGDYGSSTLSQRVSSGSTFTKSNQARYGSYTDSIKSSKAMAVASATSRGGFGSKSSARSGWGGSSSSGG